MALAVDDSGVYWATGPDAGTLRCVAGSEPSLVATGLSWPRDLALHGDQVYLALADCVARVRKTGGSLETIASAVRPHRLAVAGEHIHWIERGPGNVCRAPLGGGKTEQLARSGRWLTGIAADGDHVYWSDGQRGTIQRVDRVPGSGPAGIVTLATTPPATRSLLLDASHIYWARSDGISRVAKGGGRPESLVDGQHAPAGLVMAGGTLAWIDGSTSKRFGHNALRCASTSGGDVTTVADGLSVFALAAHEERLYWAGQDAIRARAFG